MKAFLLKMLSIVIAIAIAITLIFAIAWILDSLDMSREFFPAAKSGIKIFGIVVAFIIEPKIHRFLKEVIN